MKPYSPANPLQYTVSICCMMKHICMQAAHSPTTRLAIHTAWVKVVPSKAHNGAIHQQSAGCVEPT